MIKKGLNTFTIIFTLLSLLIIVSACSSASGHTLKTVKRPDSVNKTIWYKGKEYLDAYMKADNKFTPIDSNLAIEINEFNNKNGLAVLGIDPNHTKIEKDIIENVYWMSSQYAIYLNDKENGKIKEAKQILSDYKKSRDKLIKIYYK